MVFSVLVSGAIKSSLVAISIHLLTTSIRGYPWTSRPDTPRPTPGRYSHGVHAPDLTSKRVTWSGRIPAEDAVLIGLGSAGLTSPAQMTPPPPLAWGEEMPGSSRLEPVTELIPGTGAGDSAGLEVGTGLETGVAMGVETGVGIVVFTATCPPRVHATISITATSRTLLIGQKQPLA